MLLLWEACSYLKPPTESHTQTSILTTRDSQQYRPKWPVKESPAQERLPSKNKPPRHSTETTQYRAGIPYINRSPISLVNILITQPIDPTPIFLVVWIFIALWMPIAMAVPTKGSSKQNLGGEWSHPFCSGQWAGSSKGPKPVVMWWPERVLPWRPVFFFLFLFISPKKQ